MDQLVVDIPSQILLPPLDRISVPTLGRIKAQWDLDRMLAPFFQTFIQPTVESRPVNSISISEAPSGAMRKKPETWPFVFVEIMSTE